MIKTAVFLISLLLTIPVSVSTGSMSSLDQTEQTEVTFEVLGKNKQQKPILALRKHVQESNAFIKPHTLELVSRLSSCREKDGTLIYLRKCSLLI